MTNLINPALKLLCLAVYAIEAVLMLRHVRLYRGPLAVSIGLTLLFGLLHWKPLADRQARAAARS